MLWAAIRTIGAHRRSVAFHLFTVALVALATGLTGGNSGSAAPAATVGMVGSLFNPATVNITAGQSVLWNNDDGTRKHTVTATGGAFDSGNMNGGTTFEFTFPTPGTYAYTCIYHEPDMAGTVIVAAAAPTATPTTAPPTATPTTAPATPTPTTGGGGATATPTRTPTNTPTATPTTGGGSPPATATPTNTPTPTATPPPPAAGDVQILDSRFSPAALTVAPGTAVRWVNAGNLPHTVTATDGSFDSGFMAKGDAYTHTFTTAGTYQYICEYHADVMVGTVTVSGGSGGPGSTATTTPTPAATATPPGGGQPPAPSPGDVQILDSRFSPAALTVAPGTAVRWVNNGNLPHTVTGRLGSFDSGYMAKGDAYTHTFTTAGTYQYICEYHADVMVATVTVTGGGSPGSGPTPPATATPTVVAPPPPTAPGDVQVLDFDYGPREITVGVGTNVRFVNVGVAPHTVTANDASFDSGFMAKGDAYSHTFSSPGTYAYFCIFHPGMTGTVRVGNSSGSVPAPAPQPTPKPPPPVTVPGDVQVLDFDYGPRSISVSAGSSVRFVNAGIAPHTVTARDGSFDSGFMGTGDAFSRPFPTAGTYEYFCIYHPNMTGTVRVAGAGGAVPAAAIPPTATATSAAAPGASLSGGSPVEMVDFAYAPGTITIKPGASVTWNNSGVAPHTITDKDGKYDSGFIKRGESYTRKFETPGTYDYYCTLHPQMVGKVVVSGAQGASAAPSPDPGAADPASGAADGDPTFKNVWMVVWGIVALVGVIALPTVLIATRGRPADGRGMSL